MQHLPLFQHNITLHYTTLHHITLHTYHRPLGFPTSASWRSSSSAPRLATWAPPSALDAKNPHLVKAQDDCGPNFLLESERRSRNYNAKAYTVNLIEVHQKAWKQSVNIEKKENN